LIKELCSWGEGDMSLHSLWDLVKETFDEWSEDKASDQAAALAYYTLISLAPLLIVVIAIAGLFYHNSDAVRDALMNQIGALVGQQSALTIQEMMAGAAKPGKSFVAMIVGILVLLLGASAVFVNLQSMLNTIWNVETKSRSGIMGLIKARFFSFAMILGIGFLLLVSLVISAGIAALNQFINAYLPGGDILAHATNFIISFGIITLLFAMIFKVLPDATVRWSDVWIGAAVTALLFTIGKFLIGLYLGHRSVESSYGAAGSVIIILIWVYYSAQILFMGAEFTQVYARRRGSEIRPTPDAQRRKK
jgi:membrane protein